jgi:uncharacterized damage-inducible protein DinB
VLVLFSDIIVIVVFDKRFVLGYHPVRRWEVKLGGITMIPFFANYLRNLEDIHNDVRTAIKGLPQEVLDWAPSPDMNSMAVLVIHLIGAEQYWIGDVIVGESSGRDRDSEFRVDGITGNELLQKLVAVERYIQRVLETMPEQRLDEKRVSPRNGREVSVGWAMCHALKHTALHAGHIQITRQLWEQQHSSDGG